MKFLEVAFICHPVRKIDRARRFYEKILGLKPTSVYEGKSIWVEYDIGPTTLAIVCGKSAGTPSKTGVWVALEVNDFRKTIRELRKKKVKFTEEPHETGVCWNASIADPDGNCIVIHKRKEM